MRRLCVLLVTVIMALSCIPAFAEWDHDKRGGDRPGGPDKPGRYYYRNHRYYREGAWWDFGATTLAVGAILASRPDNGRYVVINGQTYYCCDDHYYQQVPEGYMLVQAPVVVTAPATTVVVPVAPAATVVVPSAPASQAPVTEGEPVVVNVPNSDGSYTPVTLFKHSNGYKGPQGEFYPGNPTVDQLRALYGK